MAKKMLERVGTYFYFFPTYQQGKKILWNGIDRDGFKFLDHIPHELRKRTDNTEMLIELVNGSVFQIIGTDKIDSIVGTNPIGTVWSEYALQDPKAWGYIRPILEENGGWAVFNFTSRGKNHGHDLYEFAKTRPEWFVEVLPADKTDIFTAEQLERIREEYIVEDGDDLRFQQEFMCSFEGSVQGSYYGVQMEMARKEGRIKQVQYDPAVPVDTWWDLGVGDAMAIWFTQSVAGEVRLIDYLESEGEGIPYYIAELQRKKYVYGAHYWPHDGEAREMTTGVSRKETAQKLGLRPIQIIANMGVDDGIQATRQFLSRCWFDEEKCKEGIDALKNYHKEYDEKRSVYKNSPYHDWSSHGADAFRYLAIGHAQYKVGTQRSSGISERRREQIRRSKYSAVMR